MSTRGQPTTKSTQKPLLKKKKKSLYPYPRLAYQWFYCGLDTSDCTGCKIKAKLVNSKDRVFS